ncbi:MAG: AMP-binding protein [Myxococcaceae bacterium]|nr:AMP-binding protein [Myxococcaceae bacterium]
MKLARLLAEPREDAALMALHGQAPKRWGDFRREVQALQTVLASEPAEQVGVCCLDAYPFAVALFAAWQVGKCVALPGNAGSAAELGVALWLADQPLPGVARVISPLGHPSPTVTPVAAPPSAPALTVFTSGSTGAPKPVIKMFAQLDAEVTALEAQFGSAVDGATVLATVSQQHLYGLLFRLLWPLAMGRPFVSEPLMTPAALLAHSAAGRSVWVSSPAFYRRLRNPSQLLGARGQAVAAFSSGGVLPFEAEADVAAGLGVPVFDILGSSETGGIAFRSANAPWQPLPGVEVRARENDGALMVKSPHLGHPEWQGTDDAAVFTKGGFQLMGRLDRIIKLEENRVALPAIEMALERSSWVVQACALPLQLGQRQALGVAIVLNAEGRAQLAARGRRGVVEALKGLLGPSVPGVAVPRRWRFVDALPADAQGKVALGALQALFAEEAGNTLPRVERRTAQAGVVTLQLAIDAGLPAFEGHFPQQPILPGVAQIDFAVRFGRANFTLPTRFEGLDVVKFHRVITPGSQVSLELAWDAAKARLAFVYRQGEALCSTGRIAFGADA